MYPFDRWLVRVYGLITAIGVIWMMFWLLHFTSVVSFTSNILARRVGWLWLGLAVLLILSLRYLVFRLQPPRMRAFVRETEGGQIRIGEHAVKELAVRAVKQIKGVDRVQIKLAESDRGLVIHATVHAHPVDLNAMGEELQRAVHKSVQEMTSLNIAAVHVHVVELAPETIQKL